MEKFPFGAFVDAYDDDMQWDAARRESLAQFRSFMARPGAENLVVSLMSDYITKVGSPLDQYSAGPKGSVERTQGAANLGFGQLLKGDYAARSYGPPSTSQLEQCPDCHRMRQKG